MFFISQTHIDDGCQHLTLPGDGGVRHGVLHCLRQRSSSCSYLCCDLLIQTWKQFGNGPLEYRNIGQRSPEPWFSLEVLVAADLRATLSAQKERYLVLGESRLFAVSPQMVGKMLRGHVFMKELSVRVQNSTLPE